MSNKREEFYPFISFHHFFPLGGVRTDVSARMSGVHLACMPEGTVREGLKMR